jgi:short-subunit dehydrogenase
MKRIILTGASSWLGASLGSVFHDAGYEVIGLCRSKPTDYINWIETDLCNESSVLDSVQKIQDKYSDFSLLIHCAGDGDGEDIEKLDWENAERQFCLNMIAPAILTSKLIPLIKENNTDIIGIGATIGFKPYKYFTMYGASKWAFRWWIENLQLELKTTSSRVIGVHPGWMETKWNTKRMNQIGELSGKSWWWGFMDTDDIARFILQIYNLPKNMEVSEIIINRK